MAANHAAIEGALSSAAYTGAVAATIGTGGGSPLTLSAGGLSFIVDMSYTSYLQLQKAHNISVLYGVPININDPDATWKPVRLAFGIKLSETAQRIVNRTEDIAALLTVLWWIISTDETIQVEELLLLLHLITVAADRDVNNGEDYHHFIERFKKQIEVDDENLWKRIS